MPNDNSTTNQTRFALENPILEDVPATNQELDEEIKEDLVASKKKSKKLILMGMVGLILITVFILLLILMRLNSNAKKEVEEFREVGVREEVGELSPLLREVYELGASLKAADPSLSSIPFPPLDMELRLEDRKK
jgi:hypothetical protein